MQFEQAGTASGHVFRRHGKRGSVWYAKFRDPAGKQVQKRIGQPTGRGRPPTGTYTERTAHRALEELLLNEQLVGLAVERGPSSPSDFSRLSCYPQLQCCRAGAEPA